MGKKTRSMDNLKDDFNNKLTNTNARVNNLEQDVSLIKERNIRSDLELKQPGGNYLYTQQQVADRNHVTLAYVRKVIDKYSLHRNS